MLTAVQARTAIARDWGRTLAVLDALGDAAATTPTRCAGWTLTDLARHGAWGTSMEADALRRARTGTAGTAEGREPSGGPAEVVAALRASVADLDTELGRVGEIPEGVPLELPFGPVPTPFGLAVFTMEAGVHADDAVAASGRDEALGPDVVGATTVVLPLVLPVLAGAAGSAPPAEGTVVALRGPAGDRRFAVVDGAWASATEASPAGTVAGTDDTAVLRFALGRAGTDDPRLGVEGDTGLAAEFKAWFPGP